MSLRLQILSVTAAVLTVVNLLGLAYFFSSSPSTQAQEVFSTEVDPNAHEYFADPDLNPSHRVGALRAELYAGNYQQAAPQATGGNNYRFPLSAPASTYVTQTYFGPYSHQSSRAIDWFGNNLKVAASRRGVVTTLQQGGKWDGWCNSYQSCYDQGGIWNGNHVLVTHDDGTYAYYIHLKPGTIDPNLRIGSPVAQGQVIADVGATGYTCGDGACSRPGPHLHFQVNLPNRGGTIATPFEDCDANGNQCDGSKIPVASRSYTSINYPPQRASYDGRRAGIYLLGTDLALSATTLSDNGSVRLGSPNQANSTWTYDVSSRRIQGENNFCLEDTGTTRIKVKPCSGSNRQQWSPVPNNNLQNVGSRRCLESQSGLFRGSYINAATCSASNPKQYFRTSNQAYRVASPVVDNVR